MQDCNYILVQHGMYTTCIFTESVAELMVAWLPLLSHLAIVFFICSVWPTVWNELSGSHLCRCGMVPLPGALVGHVLLHQLLVDSIIMS